MRASDNSLTDGKEAPLDEKTQAGVSADYSKVLNPARVAVYDDPLIAPRVISINPATTTEFIQNLAVCIDEQARGLGGKIPYTIILEVTENFIHAQFREIVVSVMDEGNTIRFTDQGPGIEDGGKAIRPGFTSATEPMKRYIRGVGSGLPIVHDWIDLKNGYLTIDDNIGSGAAVTISLVAPEDANAGKMELAKAASSLNEKEKLVLLQFKDAPVLSGTEVSHLCNLSPSSVNYQFKKLESAGYLEQNDKRKRVVTPLGRQLLKFL